VAGVGSDLGDKIQHLSIASALLDQTRRLSIRSHAALKSAIACSRHDNRVRAVGRGRPAILSGY